MKETSLILDLTYYKCMYVSYVCRIIDSQGMLLQFPNPDLWEVVSNCDVFDLFYMSLNDILMLSAYSIGTFCNLKKNQMKQYCAIFNKLASRNINTENSNSGRDHFKGSVCIINGFL